MRWFLGFLALVGAAVGMGQYTVTQYNDLVYTTASGYPQTLDLFVPITGVQPRPAIVFVHGGGWSGGSKADFDSWGQYYGAMGYVCISINYRLTPAHYWPAQIDDTQAAVRWMRKMADSLNVNPNRIGAVGASAGGHLVLFLGETDTLHDFDPTLSGYSSKVQAVADYFGPSDMTRQNEWDPSIWALIQALAGPGSKSMAQRWTAGSPLYYVKPTDSPTIVFQGDADPIVPVDQSRRIVARKQAVGAPVSYYEFPGEGHGFSNDPFWVSVNAITSFFAGHL